MINHKYVEEYIRLYEQKKIILNKERILLFDYLREHVLSRDDLYFDDKQITQCVAYIEKWFFPLAPFQKFIIAFLFLKHEETERLFYRKFLIMMGRGGGKNGLLSGVSNYLNSELHGIPKYNIDIVANSEDQAMTSFDEVFDVIDGSDKLKKAFKHARAKITNRKTKSILRFRTSNAETKDGGRPGLVAFDEIHQYPDSKTVNVMKGGLGKVIHPREIYIGTDGFLREGFLDKMKDTANQVLNGEIPDSNLFPFICKLDAIKEMDNPDLWEKANPMFSKPFNDYSENLYETVFEEFQDLKYDRSGYSEFITKRMNFPEVDPEKSVASRAEIMATNREMPDLKHKVCIGGLDFASIKDFAAVGLLFKHGEDYVWKSHSFARKGFLDSVNMKAPIQEWAHEGLLTIVDEPTIGIEHIVRWFVEMRNNYGLTKIVADTFRLDLVRSALEEEGFELEFVRNPRAIHSLLAPRVETAFANENIVFGPNPLMRWYTNNVLVKRKPDGNKEYIKKDEYMRKTDGFQAFIHALYKADELLEDETELFVDGLMNF